MRHVVAVGLLAVAFCSTGAHAQSVARGQSLYTQLGCHTANCHGTNPAEGQRGVLNGAGSPATIEYAATFRSEMNYLLATFDTDATAAIDLAAWLATIAPLPPPPPVPPPVATLVEYFHAAFGHYFITNLAVEIAALDGGQFVGWARTGRTINAYASNNGAVTPVCRFFTVKFAPKSSHFYTPVTSECDSLRAGTDWQYEGETFFVTGPDAVGACATGLVPVYRLYNAGQGGAPNHRYTSDVAVRSEMLAKGWAPEGLGAQGVIFCVPA